MKIGGIGRTERSEVDYLKLDGCHEVTYDELWLLRNAARDALEYNASEYIRFTKLCNQGYINPGLDYIMDSMLEDYYGLVNLTLDKMVSPTMPRDAVLKVIKPEVFA